MQKVDDVIKITSINPIVTQSDTIDEEKEILSHGFKLSFEIFQITLCVLLLLSLFVIKEFVPELIDELEKVYNDQILDTVFVSESELRIIDEH